MLIVSFLIMLVPYSSPDGRKFRSRTELSAYLDQNDSPLYIHQFDFSVRKKGSATTETPKRKAPTTADKPDAKKQKGVTPVERLVKVTPVEHLVKRKLTAPTKPSPPKPKLVVKMSFSTPTRRSIKRPARYSHSPILQKLTGRKQSVVRSEGTTAKRTPVRKKAVPIKKLKKYTKVVDEQPKEDAAVKSSETEPEAVSGLHVEMPPVAVPSLQKTDESAPESDVKDGDPNATKESSNNVVCSGADTASADETVKKKSGRPKRNSISSSSEASSPKKASPEIIPDIQQEEVAESGSIDVPEVAIPEVAEECTITGDNEALPEAPEKAVEQVAPPTVNGGSVESRPSRKQSAQSKYILTDLVFPAPPSPKIKCLLHF